MNIGILSMQKIHNYGSFLQALSLKLQMEARGCNVYFIDIVPGKQIVSQNYAHQKSNLFSKLDKCFWKRIQNYFLSQKMDKLHIEDYERYLETSKQLPEGEKFDIVIIGSDEVFNCTIPSSWGFSQQLFGKVDNADCVVTYAASCGSTTYENVIEYDILEELKSSMSNIRRFSVRDTNTFDFVKSITGITPEINVDPVFISSFDKYIPDITVKRPYMLIYAYSNRINDEREITAIKDYARENGLDIICVGMQQRWCNNNIPATAFELLSYVKNANCIVTDTFHGTVFSIKYNKQFVTLIRDSNANKLTGLLEQFSLLPRSVEDVENLSKILKMSIDFDAVNSMISKEQEKAYKYLDDIVEN